MWMQQPRKYSQISGLEDRHIEREEASREEKREEEFRHIRP